MKSQWTRREVLKYPIAASLATAVMQFGAQNSAAVEYNKPVPGSENLTAYLNSKNPQFKTQIESVFHKILDRARINPKRVVYMFLQPHWMDMIPTV